METAAAWLRENWQWLSVCALLGARVWWLERRIRADNAWVGPRFYRLERAVIGLAYAHDAPEQHAEFIKHRWDHRMEPDEKIVHQARDEVDEFRNKALGSY
jgi:hypothetical protein